MLSVLVLDTLWEDEPSISSIVKAAYAKRSLPIKRLSVKHELAALLQSGHTLIEQHNVLVVSLRRVSVELIEYVQSLRQSKADMFIVFVLDRSADVTLCVRPAVRPAGILFIPLEWLRVHQTLKEIYAESLRLEAQEAHLAFTIKRGSDYYSISISSISFFEAQGKKIAVKTQGQEISFYSSFDAVLRQLPDHFIRCHKGFVVNTRQIVQVSFSDMTLTLKDNCIIPMSRTYRDAIRALFDQGV